MKKRFVNMLGDAFLVVLAGDLLYLYYARAWQDPVRWIEVSEIVFLYLLVVFGLVRLYFHLRRAS